MLRGVTALVISRHGLTCSRKHNAPGDEFVVAFGSALLEALNAVCTRTRHNLCTVRVEPVKLITTITSPLMRCET